MRLRNLFSSITFLAATAMHSALQWYGWKLHIGEVAVGDGLLTASQHGLWKMSAFPLFTFTSRYLQNLYFTELLLANSVVWGITLAWIAYVLLGMSRHGARRVHVPAPQPAASAARTQTDRLVELKRLRDQGLITPDEFQRKRAAILTEI
jgi:hypothetical protein